MGKLIIIEGADGTGKTTQVNLLNKALSSRFTVATIKFPDYSSPSGIQISKYLQGELGRREDINPYHISAMFILDRLAAKSHIQHMLATHDYVIIDRYVWSNIALQGALLDDAELKKFSKYCLDMEFSHSELPYPDLFIVLTGNMNVVQTALQGRKGDSVMANGAVDIHEGDVSLNVRTDNIYLNLARSESGTSCILPITSDEDGGSMLSREFVASKILGCVAIL